MPNRREVLRGGLGMAAIAGIGGLEIKREQTERTKEVESVSAFLRGKSKEKLKMFGREWSYDDFVNFLERLTKPAAEAKRAVDGKVIVKQLLEAFAALIELEDRFGGRLNNLTGVELADQTIESSGLTVGLANSFGLGQIQPKTARHVALHYRNELERQKILSQEDLNKIAQENANEKEIVGSLKLQKTENLLFSFLALYEGYNRYGKDREGIIHSNLNQDPRAFTLAMAAYNAGFNAPIAASLQNRLNEFLIFNPLMSKHLGEPSHLNVDGDFGEQSLNRFRQVCGQLNVPIPAAAENLLQKNLPDEQKFQILQSMLKSVGSAWRGQFDQFRKNLHDLRGDKIMQLAKGRYSTAFNVYLALKAAVTVGNEGVKGGRRQQQSKLQLEDQSRAEELFRAFIDRRQDAIFRLLDQNEFKRTFPNGRYEIFKAGVLRSLPRAIGNDNNYWGVVPLHYRPPRFLSLGQQNPLLYCIWAHERSNSPARLDFTIEKPPRNEQGGLHTLLARFLQ